MPPTDQRGFARVVNGRLDLGAYEVQRGNGQGSAGQAAVNPAGPLLVAPSAVQNPEPGQTPPVAPAPAASTSVAVWDTVFSVLGSRPQDNLTERALFCHRRDDYRDARPLPSRHLPDLLFASDWRSVVSGS